MKKLLLYTGTVSMIFCLICLDLFLPKMVNAQGGWTNYYGLTLSRGRIWFHHEGMFNNISGQTYRVNMGYPGYYSGPSIAQFNHSGLMWKKGSEEVMANIRSDLPQDNALGDFIVPLTLHKNYNFLGDAGLFDAEEWTEGIMQFDENPYGKITVKNKTRVWGAPDYDDFIIHTATIVNDDDELITDLYYSIRSVFPPYRFINDMEYIWDPELETFIFVDDTSWPVKSSEPPAYEYPPGDQTGDKGDPGNIEVRNSINRRLYHSHVQASKYLDFPPNRDGERKIWHTILGSSETGSPAGRLMSGPGYPTEERVFGKQSGGQYADHMIDILNEQTRGSWKDLWKDPGNPRDGTVDGNLYERTPNYRTSIGPYDLQPGDSVQFTFLYCCGELDPNVANLGTIKATSIYPDSAIAHLKRNWNNAMELINSNYVFPSTQVPPPTCGLPPYVGGDDEILQAEPYATLVDDKPEQGFTLTWMAVPDDYTDPGTGEADFAGYKIYQSQVHRTGPWIMIRDLTAAEAEQFRDGDHITYNVPTDAGIPYYFGVTAYDDNGHESAMTAYTYDPAAAPVAPTNDQSQILVVPNPFKQRSGFLSPSEFNRLSFINIPDKCTIRIYTLAGDLVKTVEHEGFGEDTWGIGGTNQNYLQTDFGEEAQAGLYIYHCESHVSGHEGETSTGKFLIIR